MITPNPRRRIDLDTVTSPHRRRNDGNRPVRPGQQPCLLYGYPIDPDRARHWVHLLTSNQLAQVTDEPDGEDSQGWFPIGADCAGRLPDGFVLNESIRYS